MWMRVRVVRKQCVAMAERQRESNNIYNWRCAAIIMHAYFLYVTNAFLTHMPKRNHALTVSHVGLFLFSIFQPMQSAMSQRWTSFLMMTFSKRDALIQRLLSQSQVHTHITSHFGEPFFLLVFRFGIVIYFAKHVAYAAHERIYGNVNVVRSTFATCNLESASWPLSMFVFCRYSLSLILDSFQIMKWPQRQKELYRSRK